MFNSITPDFIHTFSARSVPPTFTLADGERKAAHKFSDSRLSDFSHGRYCAHEALAQLGIRDVTIGVGSSREPVWPAGVVGSITHTDGVAAAAVCRIANLAGIGIDCERTGRLNSDLISRICHETERHDLESAGLRADHALVLFSAKESVYKCIWPHVRRFIDFLEVTVTLDHRANSFRVTAIDENLDRELITRVRGSWRFGADYVYTAAFLDHRE